MSASGLEDQSQAFQARIHALEAELREANETLDAIRNGEVDAVVVGGPDGQIIYTLENADRPYRVLVEQMREGAVTLNEEGTILYCNSSFANLVGRRAGHIVGERFFDFVTESDTFRAMLGRSTGSGQSAELLLILDSDDPAPVNMSVVEMRVEDGADKVFCVIATDLRDNYARALELSDANHRLEKEAADRARAEQGLAVALDAADMGSWDFAFGQNMTVRSPRHDAIFGHEEPIAEWDWDFYLKHFLPEDREEVKASLRNAVQTGQIDLERRIRRASDGAIRWVHIRGRTYREAGANRVAGIIIDTTERRLIEEQLRQGQKMEAIGQLTGGIAHDFNNLLMIIGGSLEALTRHIEFDDRAKRLLNAAQIGVARGGKLNEQLLAFARRQDMQVQAVSLTDLLPTFETLLDRAVGEAVVVEIRETPDLWFCRTDPHQLETAILNLGINARDAMEGQGSLVLTTANVSVSKREAESFEAAAGDYVVMSVADNGPGMSQEIIARVFEPFFTTKALGKGTGLGLSQVYGFARQSGGFVKIQSAAGEGATISIYLPRTDESDAIRKTAKSPPPTNVAQGVVLLVEDDADVRDAAQAMLEALGYSIRPAASADLALDIIRSGAPLDVVFSDVILVSGMNGIELARKIQAERPDLPILLTSGYTAQRMNPTTVNSDPPLLRKPYTLPQLAEAIDKLVR